MDGHGAEPVSFPLWAVLFTASALVALAGIGVLTVLDWVGLVEVTGLC